MDDERLYNVILTGQVLPGHDPQRVHRAVARLYRMAPSRVARVFAQGPRLIKRATNRAKAERYLRLLRRAGAEAVMLAVRPDTCLGDGDEGAVCADDMALPSMLLAAEPLSQRPRSEPSASARRRAPAPAVGQIDPDMTTTTTAAMTTTASTSGEGTTRPDTDAPEADAPDPGAPGAPAPPPEPVMARGRGPTWSLALLGGLVLVAGVVAMGALWVLPSGPDPATAAAEQTPGSLDAVGNARAQLEVGAESPQSAPTDEPVAPAPPADADILAVTSEPAPARPDQPFGLAMGHPLAEVAEGAVALDDGRYRLAQVPQPDPRIAEWRVRAAPRAGLCAVEAIGPAVASAADGAALRTTFAAWQDELDTRYGAHLHTDLLRAPDDTPASWMATLARGERLVASRWTRDTGARLPDALAAVELRATAADATAGRLTLAYRFANEAQCDAELTAAAPR